MCRSSETRSTTSLPVSPQRRRGTSWMPRPVRLVGWARYMLDNILGMPRTRREGGGGDMYIIGSDKFVHD